VYSALSLPLFFWNITHTTIMVFWLLVALEGLIAERWGRSALALGLAIAAKLTPVFLLGPVFKLLWPQRSRWVTYGLITGVTAAAAYLPLALLGGGPWIVASFVALGKVGSWSTPWALLDGNWGPGSFGLLSTRLDLAQASVARGQPAVVPAWLSLSLFAALYAAVFFRKLERRGPQQVIWFTTLTAMLFHLWSKGWSPQWAELIIPLLLLSFPDGRGLRLVLLLTLIVFVEWPLADAFGSHALLAAAALGRTLLFMVVGLRTARLLWPAANFANPAQ
jgi:hypothetical protein